MALIRLYMLDRVWLDTRQYIEKFKKTLLFMAFSKQSSGINSDRK